MIDVLFGPDQQENSKVARRVAYFDATLPIYEFQVERCAHRSRARLERAARGARVPWREPRHAERLALPSARDGILRPYTYHYPGVSVCGRPKISSPK